MRRPRPRLVTALVSAAWAVLVGAAGCAAGNKAEAQPAPAARACTEIGCIDGLHVTLAPGDSWPAGAYVFEIETDSGSAACRGSLPLPPCGTPGLTCSGLPVQIGESGCALPPAAHGFSTLTFASAPQRVSVRIARDGQPIAGRELRPVYRRVQPNGAGCGPVCTTASDTLRVF